MTDYTVWVNTVSKVVSFHEVDACDILHFERYENFMDYLVSLTTQGYRFQ